MSVEYRIPLKFKSGKYKLNELPCNNCDNLSIFFGNFDILSYYTPEDKTEVRLYSNTVFSLNEQVINDGLSAAYNFNGKLKYIELRQDNKVKLVYIAFENDEEAKAAVIDFAEKNADSISYRLLKIKDKIARLFIEYYTSDESFDFHAKFGTTEDKLAVAEQSWNIDNCGNYPEEKRIGCDIHTFQIILLCVSRKIVNDMIHLAIDTMTERIKNKVIDNLDKSDDFRFIVSEYD